MNKLTDQQMICHAIVESMPYPVVFVGLDHVIRYMNPAAIFHYCHERGHPSLVGRSLFDCHFNPASRKQITAMVRKFRKDAKEVYLKVNDRNLRVYVSPVRSSNGRLIGYYERFELNLCLPHQSR